MSEIHITKLDAARRQLEAAVSLFFSNSDPVACHTLVAAAYDVIRDVNKHLEGKPMLLKDQMVEIILKASPDVGKALRRSLNAPQNFFKHADSDPAGSFSFETEITPFMLFDASITYIALSGEKIACLYIFNTWFQMQHTDMFQADDEFSKRLCALAESYRNISRAEFYTQMMSVLTDLEIQ